MDYYFYFILISTVLLYMCITDTNVLDWITIKVNHFFVYLQLQYIKLKWKFKRF